MHSNVVVNGQVSLNGSMVISNHNQPNMTIQQHQQLSSTIGTTSKSTNANGNNLSSSTNAQAPGNNNPVFFKKRCSSNNNAQNLLSSPHQPADGGSDSHPSAENAGANASQGKHQTVAAIATTSPKLGGHSHHTQNSQYQALMHGSSLNTKSNATYQQLQGTSSNQNRVNSQPSSQFRQTEGGQVKAQTFFEGSSQKPLTSEAAQAPGQAQQQVMSS
jgi:hypothetical protein